MFEKEVGYREKRNTSSSAIVLFGYHNGGHEFINTFKQMGKRFLVVDYNPTVIDILERQDIPYIYGDATDAELLEEIGIQSVKLVISTFTDFVATQQLVKSISQMNKSTIIICNANNHDEALKLYEEGCTYVVIPHQVGNEKISLFIKKSGLDKAEFELFREKHKSFIEGYIENRPA
jgi:voltage-gated potassium channel Kch